MRRRTYRLDKRAAAAAETRRRIVEACFDLHGEQGIAATTMSQIARRAGVAAGTIYHHFPTYEDMVDACGAYATASLRLPGPEVLQGCEGLAERLQAIAAAIFAFHGQAAGLASVRAERTRFAAVEAFFEAEEENRLALVRAALAPLCCDERAARLVAAMLDVAVHDELVVAGFTTGEAAASVASILAAGLGPPAVTSASKEPQP